MGTRTVPSHFALSDNVDFCLFIGTDLSASDTGADSGTAASYPGDGEQRGGGESSEYRGPTGGLG